MNTATQPWLNAKLPEAERVCALMNAMTTEEKLAQMIQISYSEVTASEADEWARRGAGSFLHILGDNARRIQRLATESRLGIPVLFGIDAIHGHAIHNGATVFPSQLALASSWNPALAERVGEVTAREVSAEGLHWTFSPVFCLGRDLRWGRIDETFGEDPYLAGSMGAGMVRGYQGANPADEGRIVACAKHYIAYGESTGGRDSYEASVTARGVRTTFLPPFAEALRAGCLTVMAGYESVDGVPVSANAKLLRGILKDELGFEGFVVTDWSNVTSLRTRQGVAVSAREAARKALEAGNDLVMTSPEFYGATLEILSGKDEALSRERALALIEDSVRRILTVKFRSGLFDVPGKVKTIPLADDPGAKAEELVFNCEAHRKANLEAALRSIVLLKNEAVGARPTLPICGHGRKARAGKTGGEGRPVRTIAVIGPNADSVRSQFGDWTFFTHPKPRLDAVPSFRVTTMLEGIRARADREGIAVIHEKGCEIDGGGPEGIERARRAAAKADIVFYACGDSIPQTGEGHDRANLALTGRQNELARALRSICDRKGIPLVAILVNGKPLEFSTVADCSDAILETFNSGTLGGEAVARIAFGDENPSGRLPISFPRVTGQLPVYYNQLPGWHDGKYFDCDATPLFAFGEGLSYTSFRYDAIGLSTPRARRGETVDVRVTVTNSGERSGVETVQVYARDRVASVVRPVRELRGFAQIELKSGETATVSIPIAVDSLALVTPDERLVVEPGEFEIQAGHDSRPGSLITAILTVED